MTFESTARQVATTILGLVIAGGSGFFLWIAMHQKPTIDVHLVYPLMGGVFFGAILIAPRVMIDAAKQLLALLPSVKIGGGSPPTP